MLKPMMVNAVKILTTGNTMKVPMVYRQEDTSSTSSSSSGLTSSGRVKEAANTQAMTTMVTALGLVMIFSYLRGNVIASAASMAELTTMKHCIPGGCRRCQTTHCS